MRKKFGFVSCIVIVGLLFFSRDVIVTKGIEVYVSRKLTASGWSVQSIYQEKNSLRIENLSYKDLEKEVSLKDVHAAFHLSFFPPRLEPVINIAEMNLTSFSQQESVSPMQLPLAFLASSQVDLRLSIEKGSWKGPGKDAFAFSFSPGQRWKEIGMLSIQNGEESPFLSVHLSWEGRCLLSDVQIEQGQVADLVALSSFLCTNITKGWERNRGEVFAQIKSRLHLESGLEEMEGSIDLKKMHLSNSSFGVEILSDSLKGTLHYSKDASLEKAPFWKKSELFLTFEETYLNMKQKEDFFGLEGALGEIRLHPKEDPYLKVGGKLLSQGMAIPFEMEGKGEVLEKGAYWLQMQSEFFLPDRTPSILASFCQNEAEESTLQVDCKDLSQEVFEVLQFAAPLFEVPKCHVEKGSVSGRFLTFFKQKEVNKIEFLDCLSSDLVVSIPSKNALISVQKLSFSSALEKDSVGDLSVISLTSELQKGGISLGGAIVAEDIFASIGIENGAFLPSYIEGVHEGIFGSAQVLEEASKDLLHIECKARSGALVQKIRKGHKEKEEALNPVFLVLDISAKEDKTFGAATIRFTSTTGLEEDLEVKMELDKKLNRDVKTLLSSWNFPSCKGAFKIDRLSSETGKFWVQPWIGSLVFNGFLKGEGVFNAEELSLELSQADFTLSDGMWDVDARLGKQESKIALTYGYKESLWKGTIPIELLRLHNSLLDLDAEVKDTLLFFEGDQLWTDSWKGQVGQMDIYGSLLVNPKGIHIASKGFEGAIQSLPSVVQKKMMGLTQAGLEGNFEVGDRDCVLEGQKVGDSWSWTWDAAMKLKKMSCSLGEDGKISDGEAAIFINSNGDVEIKQVQAVGSFKDVSVNVSLQEMKWSFQETDPILFSLSIDGKDEKWGRFQGYIERNESKPSIHFSSGSHILGLAISIDPFTIGNDAFQLASSIELDQLPTYLDAWNQMCGKEMDPFESPCSGLVDVLASYNLKDGLWRASLKSLEVSFQERALGEAVLRASGKGSRLTIDEGRIGSCSLKGTFEKKLDSIGTSNVQVTLPNGVVTAVGSYNVRSNLLQIPSFSSDIRSQHGFCKVEGTFEGAYIPSISRVEGKGVSSICIAAQDFPGLSMITKAPFSFDSSWGAKLGPSQWKALDQGKDLARSSIQEVAYFIKENRLMAQNGEVHLFKGFKESLEKYLALEGVDLDFLADQEIDAEVNLEFSPECTKITGILKDLAFWIKETALEAKQMQFLLEDTNLYLSCKTKYQGQPFYVQLQTDLKESPSVCLLMKETPDTKGIVSKWSRSSDKQWLPESIQGNFQGISLWLEKGGREHDLKLSIDFSKEYAFLPKAWKEGLKKWGLGKGYTFEGFVSLDRSSPFNLKGEIVGENFEALGQIFDHFHAKVDFSKNGGKMCGVRLEDEKVKASIKTVDFSLNPETDAWEIACPLIHIQDFIPALHLKGSKNRSVKIQNLSLYDLKGSLGQLDSLQATGAFSFASLEQKKFSLWDIPLTLMKDWGLDPGLLTPVTGEVDFSLDRGRFYLTALRNVFSEGERSEFYLTKANSEAYLSYDGSWHVDLAMKQKVLWKVTEDLILSIRGTLEKPKYSLKLRKKSR